MGPPQDLVQVSVVIPVSVGGRALAAQLSRIDAYTRPGTTPLGRGFQVEEVLLVWDQESGLGDDSVHSLARQYPWVHPVWLSRQFGAQAATLAGMSSSGGKWILTIGEDESHDPALLPLMIDAAYEERAQLVYVLPAGPARTSTLHRAGRRLHGLVSRLVAPDLGFGQLDDISDCRLVLGEVGRSVAAYAGPGVQLDSALSWVVSSDATFHLRIGRRPDTPADAAAPSGHERNGRRSRAWVPHPFRVLSWIGFLQLLGALVMCVWVAGARLIGDSINPEWAITFIALTFSAGVLLIGLAVIARYAQAAANMSFGRPLYIVVSDPRDTFSETTSTVEP